MLEPMRCDPPPRGYLERIRELATREEAVLILDEVTTNFRFGPNRIQDIVGEVPDIACFAKAISNGYAMGAVVGKRWVTEAAAQMFITSTYWSDLVGIAAAITTLQEIQRCDVPGLLRRYGEQLQSGMREVLDEVDLPMEVHGLPATPSFEFVEPGDPAVRHNLTVLVAQEAVKRGVLFNAHPRQCADHDDRDLSLTLEAFAEVLLVARDAIRENCVDEVLEVSRAPAIVPRMVQAAR